LDTRLRLPHEMKAMGLRLRGFRSLFLIAFLCLVARLWYLQIVKGKEFDARAQGVRVRNVFLPAPRGIIYDRDGRILVTSRSSYTVSLIPAYLRERKSETIHFLATLLGMQASEIEEILKRSTARSFDPVRIKPDADIATIIRIEENRVRLPGVHVVSDISRSYSQGAFAAHALGYIGEISPEELEKADTVKWRAGDLIGKFGIEGTYNEYLHGAKGAEQIEVDAIGRPTRHLGEKARIPGSSVMLALNTRAQAVAERELAKRASGGSVIAMDVRNGEILVLASSPDFDPNVFSGRVSPAAWRKLVNDPRRPLINRAISSKYPPGSTFKLITLPAALEAGAVDAKSTVYCDGKYKLGRTFRCWKRSGHGTVDIHSAMALSCDVYFYTAGRKVGQRRLAEMSLEFGLGSPTGVDLHGEVSGTVPSPEWKRKYFKERWYPGDTINMSIGQGFLETTPIQMTCVTAAVANGGYLLQPHLLKKVIASDGEALRLAEPEGRQVRVGRGSLSYVQQGMRLAVTAGTARVLNLPQLAIAAKTGSAEDVHSAKPHAWIVSYAPYEQPQVAVTVLLENAGHGGSEAGPIARDIYRVLFERRFRKPPERTAVAMAP